jgi:hypothetical protein
VEKLKKLAIGIIVVLIISTIPSFANYNPKTGRFMQRDPLGTGPLIVHDNDGPHILGLSPEEKIAGLNQYIDGMNLYEYVKSNTIILTDPLGGCAGEAETEMPNMCFCVDSMSIHPVKIITGTQPYDFVGAEFTVNLNGTWKKDCTFKPFDFEWWEWYTTPATNNLYRGRSTMHWEEMYEGNEDNPIFQNITQQCHSVGEDEYCTYTITDKPGTTIPVSDYEQDAYFAIRAYSSCDDCEWEYWTVWAHQEYKGYRTNNEYNIFNVLGGLPTPPGDPPYKHGN